MSMTPRQNVITVIGDAIIASIGSDIGNRVHFSQEAPQDELKPYATYFGVSDVPVYDMGKENLDADYQINIFGEKDKGALALIIIGDTLIDDLSREPMAMTGYTNVDVQIKEAGRIVVEGDFLHLIIEMRIQGFQES